MPLSDPSQFLMVKVDPDIVDMVDDFLENQRREVLKLRTALATDQWQTVRRIGHGLKGIGGMYGFSWITEAGRVMSREILRRSRNWRNSWRDTSRRSAMRRAIGVDAG